MKAPRYLGHGDPPIGLKLAEDSTVYIVKQPLIRRHTKQNIYKNFCTCHQLPVIIRATLAISNPRQPPIPLA